MKRFIPVITFSLLEFILCTPALAQAASVGDVVFVSGIVNGCGNEALLIDAVEIEKNGIVTLLGQYPLKVINKDPTEIKNLLLDSIFADIGNNPESVKIITLKPKTDKTLIESMRDEVLEFKAGIYCRRQSGVDKLPLQFMSQEPLWDGVVKEDNSDTTVSHDGNKENSDAVKPQLK